MSASPARSITPTPSGTFHAPAGPRWMRAMSITIDGPAGSGKSTLARQLAESLGYQYIDTGAMYRAVAWLAVQRGIPLDDDSRLRGLAIAQPVSLPWQSGRWTVRIAGFDVTDLIREPQIDEAASRVAVHDGLRAVLVARQRELSLQRDSVLDGRDCGTVVRPDADLKVLVTASVQERARRRTDQFNGKLGSQAKVEKRIRERDERDAPQSVPAADAIVVDTTDRSIEGSLALLTDTWIDRRHELLNGEVTGGRTALEWIDVDMTDSFRRVMKLTSWLWRRGFRLRAHGVERVPDRSCVFIANHASMWDPAFVIVPLKRPIRYMAKVEAAKLPIYNRLGDSIGMFPVRRGAGDRVAMHIADSVLRRGDSMGIFPEGTRVYDGRLNRPKSGAARLALVANVPIVPVAIYGNRWSESGFRVSVAFGQPHYFEGQRATPGNVERATDAVWNDVEELWIALRSGRRL